jgi:hypothetical protein
MKNQKNLTGVDFYTSKILLYPSAVKLPKNIQLIKKNAYYVFRFFIKSPNRVVRNLFFFSLDIPENRETIFWLNHPHNVIL